MSKCKIDPYFHQKAYQQKNKEKINELRVIYNHKKKYGKFLNTTDKIQTFKKHKTIYLKLKELDKDLVLHFLVKNLQ